MADGSITVRLPIATAQEAAAKRAADGKPRARCSLARPSNVPEGRQRGLSTQVTLYPLEGGDAPIASEVYYGQNPFGFAKRLAEERGYILADSLFPTFDAR